MRVTLGDAAPTNRQIFSATSGAGYVCVCVFVRRVLRRLSLMRTAESIKKRQTQQKN